MQRDLPTKTLILQTILAQPQQRIGLGDYNTIFQVLINLKFLTPPLILITQGEICQMRSGVEKTFSELSKRVSPAEDFYNRWEECGIQCQLSKRLTGPIIPLSWSCLVCKRVSHVDVINGAVNNHFSVYEAIFGMVTKDHPTKQLGELRASLLLTSEKPVFCKREL